MSIEQKWNRAVETLRGSAEVAVFCHVGPDGDAFGSMLALGLALENKGKKVWMSWGSTELAVSYSFAFLPGIDKLTPPDRLPEQLEIVVAIDCADIHRLEMLVPRFQAAGTSINVDHHLSNPGFADVNLVVAERASSCELAYELIKRLGAEVDADIATCLYTGVVTDTGRFQYSNTRPETLRVAAELLELGARHQSVAQMVYESASLGQVRALGIALGRAVVHGDVVYSWLLRSDLGELGAEAAEDVIDVLRTVREARLTLLLKEQPDGWWKGSLRSRSGGDVSVVAGAFGGGGHAAAAGFNVRGELEEVLRLVLERLGEISP
ncbi:MAG: DHH family phosphoesterase [Actinomycetota bacterium]